MNEDFRMYYPLVDSEQMDFPQTAQGNYRLDYDSLPHIWHRCRKYRYKGRDIFGSCMQDSADIRCFERTRVDTLVDFPSIPKDMNTRTVDWLLDIGCWDHMVKDYKGLRRR